MAKIAIAPSSKTHDYEESVRRAGGEPVVLDPTRVTPADVVRDFDGLLLAGGGRDEYELELVTRALEADMPVFAICRGIQVLNVARGGTLVQDIPSEISHAEHHDVREPRFAIAHDVWITPGSLLEGLMRERIEEGDACAVNSRHHQAPKTLGTGLVVTATAPDGVVEAIEDPSKRFCLGVQWHPENFWRTGEFRALFEGFVKAARR